ncbi:MAG: sialate O-acetylesterase, partial [Prosthecobacter sp.]|nr:sialate O-acetylesterase [Prosthecobacter sp.]
MRLLLFSLSLCLAASAQEAVKLTLTAPLDYQVYQRSTPKEGKIMIAGNVETPPDATPPQVILARITGEGADGKWQPVVFDPLVPAFRTELSAPAGGWYRFEIKAWAQSKAIAEAATEHVGVGEVFVVAGQSNSANHGEEKLSPQSGKVAAFNGSKWQPANDPQPGASGNGGSFLPVFGDAMVERFKVPVGFVATGVGATSVRDWLPSGTRFTNPPTLTQNTITVGRVAYESRGGIYNNLINRMKALGPNGFRAVLWHQGESDANQQLPDRTLPGAIYQNLLETLISSSQRDSGSKAPWFVAQVSYHGPNDTASADIRLAQRMTWESGAAREGPDSDSLTGDLRERGGQGIHFSGKGLREHARLWVETVAPWLEGQLAGKHLIRSYVKLSPLFSDGAVLQRDVPLPIWGSASAGESITVEFAGQKQTTTTDAKGVWSIKLAPLTASSTPQTLTVRGKEDVRVLRDVLVGEVWLASGQSNMHWTFAPGQTVDKNEEELAAANDPLVRQFTTRKGGVNSPALNVSGTWHKATRNDLLTGGAMGDSALAYFFARELKAKLGVPVGIINSSVGGTPIEQWSPGGG